MSSWKRLVSPAMILAMSSFSRSTVAGMGLRRAPFGFLCRSGGPTKGYRSFLVERKRLWQNSHACSGSILLKRESRSPPERDERHRVEATGRRSHHRRAERSLAEINLRKGAPDLHFGHVFHVLGYNDFFLERFARIRLGFQLVEQIYIAIGIDNLPVRVWRIRHDEVAGERQDAISILDAVSDGARVHFGPLELRRCVRAHLCEGGGKAEDQNGKR